MPLPARAGDRHTGRPRPADKQLRCLPWRQRRSTDGSHWWPRQRLPEMERLRAAVDDPRLWAPTRNNSGGAGCTPPIGLSEFPLCWFECIDFRVNFDRPPGKESPESVFPVSRRKQIDGARCSPCRQAAAACSVSRPVVRRWLRQIVVSFAASCMTQLLIGWPAVPRSSNAVIDNRAPG